MPFWDHCELRRKEQKIIHISAFETNELNLECILKLIQSNSIVQTTIVQKIVWTIWWNLIYSVVNGTKYAVGVWSPAVNPHTPRPTALPHSSFCLFALTYERRREMLLLVVVITTWQHRTSLHLPTLAALAVVVVVLCILFPSSKHLFSLWW